jgi:hypothetical protein
VSRVHEFDSRVRANVARAASDEDFHYVFNLARHRKI